MRFSLDPIEVSFGSFIQKDVSTNVWVSWIANEEGSAVMSHRLVPSIYQVFMAAIGKIDIPPGLWRTFRDDVQTWRHRPAVIYGESLCSRLGQHSAVFLIERQRTTVSLFRLGSINLRAFFNGYPETLVERSDPPAIRLYDIIARRVSL